MPNSTEAITKLRHIQVGFGMNGTTTRDTCHVMNEGQEELDIFSNLSGISYSGLQ